MEKQAVYMTFFIFVERPHGVVEKIRAPLGLKPSRIYWKLGILVALPPCRIFVKTHFVRHC